MYLSIYFDLLSLCLGGGGAKINPPKRIDQKNVTGNVEHIQGKNRKKSPRIFAARVRSSAIWEQSETDPLSAPSELIPQSKSVLYVKCSREKSPLERTLS